MSRQFTPRQIADNIVNSLVVQIGEFEKGTGDSARDCANLRGGALKRQAGAPGPNATLSGLYRGLLEAYFRGEPLPINLASEHAFEIKVPDGPVELWGLVEAAVQYAADARNAALTQNVSAAWRSAAEASYWHGAVSSLLSAKSVALDARRRRIAESRKKGGAVRAAQGAKNRDRVRKMYQEGGPWKSKNQAAEAIERSTGIAYDTIRVYLRNVHWTGDVNPS